MVVLLPILLYHHILVDMILILLFYGLKLTLEYKSSEVVLVATKVQKKEEFFKLLDIVEETSPVEQCGLNQMYQLVILVI